MFCVLRSQACDRVNLRPVTLATSTGSVGRPVGRAARQPKQLVDGLTGGTLGQRGAMAHGLAVFLLAGIRREVVRVGVHGSSEGHEMLKRNDKYYSIADDVPIPKM